MRMFLHRSRLGEQGKRSMYVLRAGIAWMTISSPLSKTRTTVQLGTGVEALAKLPVERATLVEGLNPQRPLCRLDRILRRDSVLERARVNLHAAK
jgi:hypothetical protein